jgi:hydroxymethylpyrimidine/phosphomethylpyrimidine kinase
MRRAPSVVLTIAGFDPSSGAGITADIKTIAAHGCFGAACITALTVQSTMGVQRVEPVDPTLVSSTLGELASDFEIDAVHVGMLGSGKVARVVAEFLAQQELSQVVLDPVLKSSSGAELLDESGKELLVELFFPLATVITPNVTETSVLTGLPVTTPEQMSAAARELHAMGAKAVVITGGDLEKAIDLLSFTTKRGIEQETFKSERQRSQSTHGTGCAFSTAIACHLAQARGVPEAVLLAKAYVTAAISHAYTLGHGTGPVHHLYRMYQQRRVVIAEPEPV